MTNDPLKPFIICEVGSNWTNYDDCVQSIKEAATTGAHAVKFQLFSHKELYGLPGPQMVGELPRHWVNLLARECDKAGIEFMCSAFSAEGLSFVDPYVKRHKIASSCITDKKILNAAYRKQKPVYLSTGASSLDEIKTAMNIVGSKAMPLYCVASYPAKVIDLRCIRTMSAALHCDVGFSDHSTDALVVPRMAVQMGAVVIEKHYSAIKADTPDAGHSINTEQFKLMIQSIEGTLPEPRIGWTKEEQDMVLKHRSRCIVTSPIKEGQSFILDFNFGIYRSKVEDTKGLHGFSASGINGSIAARSLAPGDSIGPNDIRQR